MSSMSELLPVPAVLQIQHFTSDGKLGKKQTKWPDYWLLITRAINIIDVALRCNCINTTVISYSLNSISTWEIVYQIFQTGLC